MKKPVFFALALAVLSSAGHLYLSRRAYALTAGTVSKSPICHIGENISCDPTLLSPYAKILGLSVSNFGLGLNLILAGLLIGVLFLSAGRAWRETSLCLGTALAIGSVFFGGISWIQGLFCPVCFALYVLSFAGLGLLFYAFRHELQPPLGFIKQNFRNKKLYISLGAVLFISFFTHISFVTAFDIKGQKPRLQAVFADWLGAKANPIPTKALMTKGDNEAFMIITEFADFLCPACNRFRAAIESFLKNFPGAALHFYLYPLDGACNPAIKFKSDSSCDQAFSFVCSIKQGKGEKAYDFLFKNQDRFLRARGDKNLLKALRQELTGSIGLAPGPFEACLRDPATKEAVKASAEAGTRLNIQGTPAFFINGKRLSGHSPRLLVLRQIHKHLKNQKGGKP